MDNIAQEQILLKHAGFGESEKSILGITDGIGVFCFIEDDDAMIESEGISLGNHGKGGNRDIFREFANRENRNFQIVTAKVARQMPDVGSHFG